MSSIFIKSQWVSNVEHTSPLTTARSGASVWLTGTILRLLSLIPVHLDVRVTTAIKPVDGTDWLRHKDLGARIPAYKAQIKPLHLTARQKDIHGLSYWLFSLRFGS